MDVGLLIWFQVLVPVICAGAAVGSVAMAASAAAAAWAVHVSGPVYALSDWFFLDALSAYHLLVLQAVFCLSSFFAWRYFRHEEDTGNFDLRTARRFGALWFGSAAAMTLVLVSNNLGILWVGIEATTLLTAFLICLHVTPSSLEAMWKYLIMCSVGVAFAFIGTMLIAAAAVLAVATRNRQWTLYAAALLAAFLLFCLYLKWQPFLARLELPLFVLGAPLAGLLVEKLRYPAVALILALFLVNNARPALFENWTRPLKGPHSLLTTARDDNYFSDMGQWNNRASYLESVDRTARSSCTEVGLDISENQLEYPFQALLRERNPKVRFVHTGVANASARYAAAGAPPPCAALCPDCIANQQKIALYRGIGPPIEIGRFLLFLKK